MYVVKFELLHFVADLQALVGCKYKVWVPCVSLPHNHLEGFFICIIYGGFWIAGRNEK